MKRSKEKNRLIKDLLITAITAVGAVSWTFLIIEHRGTSGIWNLAWILVALLALSVVGFAGLSVDDYKDYKRLQNSKNQKQEKQGG